MSRREKNKDLLLAWEALLQGLGVKLSWSINSGELYSTPNLSMGFDKKVGHPIPTDLTPRERQVLRWMLAGKSSREIATTLGVSPRTVEKHIQRVYRKAGVSGRSDLLGAKEWV